MKGLIIFPFQPAQCGMDSKKIKNKEPYYILQLSDISEKQGLWFWLLSSHCTLFIYFPLQCHCIKYFPSGTWLERTASFFDLWSNLDLVSSYHDSLGTLCFGISEVSDNNNCTERHPPYLICALIPWENFSDDSLISTWVFSYT